MQEGAINYQQQVNNKNDYNLYVVKKTFTLKVGNEVPSK